MGFALLSLTAQMFVPVLILYWLLISLFGSKRLTKVSRIGGFFLALPCAATAALILSPSPVSVTNAETMYWPSVVIGAAVGAVFIILVGRRNSSAESTG